MSYRITVKEVLSSDGVHTLYGKVYAPEGEVRALFQIAHGMTEYIGRYHEFMAFLAENGFAVFAHDHMGHGKTGTEAGELGFIAEKNGHEILIEDVRAFAEAVKADFPGKKHVLMGHSMGSFIARNYAARYGEELSGLVLMGTGGPNPIAGAGLALIGIIKTCKRPRHISTFIDKMAFGGYNKRFDDGASDPRAWLTKDGGVREKYANDPFCNYKFTVSAMGDLIRLTKNANRGGWFKSLPAGLPILLVSGHDDPVGDFGKGVELVCAKLQKAGHPVTCRLYDGYRHEILNDASHDRVVADILDFLQNAL